MTDRDRQLAEQRVRESFDATIIRLESRLEDADREIKKLAAESLKALEGVSMLKFEAERDSFWIACSRGMGFNLYGSGLAVFNARYPDE